MKKYFFSSLFLLVFGLVFTASLMLGASAVLAQTPPTNLGPVTNEENKNPIQNGDNQNVSSCPDGSVLVGFNLYNQGGSYSTQGSLYCSKVLGGTLESAEVKTYKVLIQAQEFFGGFYFSICPRDSVVTGFNLYNVGGNFNAYGSLYCSKVSGLELLPIVTYKRHIVQSPTSKDANPEQISASSCPEGSVLVGFSIDNMGDNYSTTGDVHCREIKPFVYDLSATNIASLSQGGTGSSNVATTSGPSTTFSSKYTGYCRVTDNRKDIVYVPNLPVIVTFYVNCANNSPNFDPKSKYNKDTLEFELKADKWTNYYRDYVLDIDVGASFLDKVAFGYASGWCGESQFEINRLYKEFSYFSCKKSVSDVIPAVTQPVTLTLTKILDAGDKDVLAKKDGAGIHFVSFSPATVTPPASATLTVRADANVPAGTYIATVVSNTSDNAVVNMRTTTFNITVKADAPKDAPDLTASAPISAVPSPAPSPLPPLNTVPVNVSTTFTSKIVNSGTVATNAVTTSAKKDFSNKFQTATGYNPTTNVATGVVDHVIARNISNLAANGGNATISGSLKFSQTGMYVRACADLPPNDNGVVPESNEGNNCSAWTSVNVTDVLVTTGSLSGQGCTIQLGKSSCTTSLNWAITNPEAIPTSITARESITPAYPAVNVEVTRTLVASQSSIASSLVVPYPSRTFYLNNKARSLFPASNGSGLTVSANCVSGTSWDNTKNQCLLDGSGGGDGFPDRSNFTATSACGTGAINLSWNHVSDASSYTIRDDATSDRIDNPVSIYTDITGGSAARRFTTHGSLVPGSTHIYTIRANSATGNSDWVKTSPVWTIAPASCIPTSQPGACSITIPDDSGYCEKGTAGKISSFPSKWEWKCGAGAGEVTCSKPRSPGFIEN